MRLAGAAKGRAIARLLVFVCSEFDDARIGQSRADC